MIEDLEKEFAQYDNVKMSFDDIPKPTVFRRADLCAFQLLDCLCPSTVNMISSAELDKIWLATDCDRLAKTATKDHVKFLVRCGVHYEPEFNSLAMFV